MLTRLLLLCGLLTSCGLFGGPDPQPAALGVDIMTEAYDNTSAALRRLVDDPENGMAPDVRQKFQDGLAANDEAFDAARVQIMEWLSLLSRDWETAYKTTRDAYEAIRKARRAGGDQ